MRFVGGALLLVILVNTGSISVSADCPDGLPCDDGAQCVKRGEWCDGTAQCADESDEAYCKEVRWYSYISNKCKDVSHFLCSDGRCVPAVAKCDGYEDCKDGSDEETCDVATEEYPDYYPDELEPTEPTTVTDTPDPEGSEEEDRPTIPIQKFSQTSTADSNIASKEDSTTVTSSPIIAQNVPLRSTTATGFYAKRMKEETDQTFSHLPELDTSYSSPTTTEIVHITPQVRVYSATFRPLTSSRTTTARSPTSSIHYVYAQTPTPSYDSRSLPQSYTQATRSYDTRTLPEQSRTFILHPTRAYVPSQNFHQYNTPEPYDSRRDPYQQPTHDSRRIPFGPTTQSTGVYESRGQPSQYHSQPVIPYVYEQDPNRYQTQPTRAYDSRYDPNRHQTQPTRAYDPRYDPQPTRAYDPRYDPQPTRAYAPRYDPHRHQPQPTRAYDPRYDPQPTRAYDPRYDPNRHQTQPTRAYDPNRYQTQPTRAYDPRYDPNRHQTPRPYDSRRDPNRYQTQPTRPYDSRQGPRYQPEPTSPYDPRRHPYQTTTSRYPYSAPREVNTFTTTPGYRYPTATHREYIQRGIYYGYYDEDGIFVVLNTNFGNQRFPRPIERQTDIDDDLPIQRRNPVGERNRQEPVYPSPSPITFVREVKAPASFYFPKDYARIYGDKNYSYLRKGKEYILSLRNSSGGWGGETPRALVALSLLNNSFVNDTFENNIMLKNLKVFLGTNLLRDDPIMSSPSRLSMAVHALLATCQDPRDFEGRDLVVLIRSSMRKKPAPFTTTAHLAICLADADATSQEEHELMAGLRERTLPDAMSRDMLSLSILAGSCHLQRHRDKGTEQYRHLNSLVRNATGRLLNGMLDDGSFGSVYSTALAAQALLSVNDSRHWNPEQTLSFLKRQQHDDGSFGDFLATYWTLPALSGRSLLHLRNTICSPPKADRDLTPSEIAGYGGPKQNIRYSLFVGHPKTNANSLELVVPKGINFYDVMRLAEHQNEAFKFLYEEKDEKIHVYSISNIPNDSERGLEWHLYARDKFEFGQDKLNIRERVTGDIRDFHPKPHQHVIFWYHSSNIPS